MRERFVKSSLAIVIFLFINLELLAEEKIKIVTTFTIIADITKNITVMGATGSIGQSTLALARQFPEAFSIAARGFALSAGNQSKLPRLS